MPSDPRVLRALALLDDDLSRFRATLATTLEMIRGFVAAGRSDHETRSEHLRAELGPFAGSRIDPSRITAVLERRDALDAPALRRLERSSDALRNVLSAGSDLFHLDVPPGGDLVAAVQDRFTWIGRAFAAGRVASAARHGRVSGMDEEAALEGLAFAQWTDAERRLAPPLVVTLAGTALMPAGLAAVLDGSVKIVLIADGVCPPAPLARLITPGLLVIQAHDVEAVWPLAASRAAAVAAVLPSSSTISFTHDPGAGPEPWQRMSVTPAPDLRRVRIGALSVAQQVEELRQLEMLSKRAAESAPPAAVAVPDDTDPVDRLAAWLLEQADVAAPARE